MRKPRWCPLLVALTRVTAAFASFRWLRDVRLSVVAVAGESMTPAFLPGDFILIARRDIPRNERAYGLVVCLRAADDRLLLKRIVGVPGDSLRIGTTVQVAGRALLEPHAHGETPAAQYRGVSALGLGEYLVLGDNRAASTDSRDFGAVRAEQIEGIAVLRYWPPERLGLIRRAPRRFAASGEYG